MNKVIALCPADSVTGGPELLHQFISALRDRNVEAKILYYPLGKHHEIPKPYVKYNIETATIEECSDSIVVIPEVATGLIKKLKAKQSIIWWLSVDNYFKPQPKTIKSKIRHKFNKYILLNPSFLNMKEIKRLNISHLTQSHYAKIFLESKGIKEIEPLSDYLNDTHLKRSYDISAKENIICYNPKKGIDVTNMLINSLEEYKFIPIINMTAKQVSDLLARSKIYLDFGNHPGKDRIPREAAMAGCAVVTGIQGSAGNHIDILVPSKYKINEEDTKFISDIRAIINYVFNDFETAHEEFKEYRARIKNEKNIFENEIDLFIEKYLG